MDLYFFDLDKTLYAYDFRKRLPELARLSGASQYRLAKLWWVSGREERAEAGEWPTVDAYPHEFPRVTGGRRLTLEEWAAARALAMTGIDGSIAALRRAAQLGTVSLLSNNPAPLCAALPLLAPDIAEIPGSNVLQSFQLDARKPSAVLFERAMAHYGGSPENTFFTDDSLENIVGARALGFTAHRLDCVDNTPQTDEQMIAIEAFASRSRA